ncbi:hypothetical protein ANN_01285 [Periplaneta americana]|uniref:Uncharacterized protein n=1 Tax=Periplaneta americana TaxID=6978 RepID=A0ABQ8TT87_PERAM|nr:hypothetical protein ANN_01285 [Periplaneta americana]
MAGLCEGGNEPSGSLKASKLRVCPWIIVDFITRLTRTVAARRAGSGLDGRWFVLLLCAEGWTLYFAVCQIYPQHVHCLVVVM